MLISVMITDTVKYNVHNGKYYEYENNIMALH